MIRQTNLVGLALFGVLVAPIAGACGGATPTASPTPPAPAQTATPSVAISTPSAQPATPTAPPSTNPAPTPSAQGTSEASVGTGGPPTSTGPAALSAPDAIPAGTPFDVVWTGPNAPQDYVTIVASGTTAWTSEPYFYTTAGSPGKLVAPTTPGNHELWYVNGADGAVVARRPIAVTAFAGTIGGADTVAAGTVLSIDWTGPNAPGDYVTIVPLGTDHWTDESFFNTTAGSPGSLVAPIVAGAYELWYVAGADAKTMLRRPVAVSPLAITLKAPASVSKGAQFQVVWTGPNGPSDYVTIVPAGSPVGTYASYTYTNTGSPVTLSAPDTAGAYEIRYQSDRVAGTFASIPIKVN